MGDEVRNYLYMEFLSTPENVGVARMAVAVFAAQLDFTLGEIDEIKVATSEAVSNSVIHGYKDRSGKVAVRAEIRGKVLGLVVEDWGCGIEDISLAKQPSYTTDPERMGLGLVFIEAFTDSLDIVSAPGKGTRLEMLKTPQRHQKKADG